MSWMFDLEVVVDDFRLEANLSGDNDITFIVGPNGGGKSTLLRVLCGAVNSSQVSGRFHIDDEVLVDSDRAFWSPPQHRQIGYLPQNLALFPHFTVVENVAYALRFRSALDPNARRERALELLNSLDIGGLADRNPDEISGGQAQRVALARALASNPRALLLDEPMSSLDASGRRVFRALLAQTLPELEIPTFFVTHDVRDTRAFDSQIAVLENGRFVQTGTLDELRANPSTDFIREFVDLAG